MLTRRRKLLSRQGPALDLESELLGAYGELFSLPEPPEQILEDMIANALALMEGGPKEMLELTFIDGKSRRELATHLQISAGAVAHRLQRAKAELRALIEDAARCRLADDEGLSMHTRDLLREFLQRAEL